MCALFKSKVWKVLSKGNNALAIPQHDSLQSADGKYEKKLENFHHKQKQKKQGRHSKASWCLSQSTGGSRCWKLESSECKLTAGQLGRG